MTSPGESRPSSEILPDFLPNTEGDPISMFTYARQLEAQAQALDPEQEGRFRAIIVAECPTDNESWEAKGVRPGYGEDGYHAILLPTVSNAARDTEITASMVQRLHERAEQMTGRISEDLAKTIVARTLNTAEAHPDATIEIVQWAIGFMTAPDSIKQAVQSTLYHKSPEQLAQLMSILDRLGQTEASSKIQEALQDHEERIKAALEKQRADQERRAAEQARRQDAQERINYIRDNAIQAFGEIAAAHGITTPEDIQRFSFENADELLLAASCIATQSESGYLDISSENAAIGVMSTIVLDKAVELRRAGISFPNQGFTLDKHEERAVIGALSVDDFWNSLAKLAEWRSDMNPRQISGLYEEWRIRFIAHRQLQQAKEILEEYGIDHTGELRPEGIDFLNAKVSNGIVNYDSVDELIKDMRAYFVPRTDRFEPGVAASEAVDNAIGSSFSIALLSEINQDHDPANMDRLEAEIRAWVENKDETYYRDSYDDGHGDPYKYSSGLFTGHGIGIIRHQDGSFGLSLTGRGYNYNGDNPTQHIDNFAAFVGKEATYDGAISLEYRAEPPAEFVKGTVTRSFKKEAQDAVAASLPVESILRKLQDLLNLQDEAVERLWQLIIEHDPTSDDVPAVQNGEVLVGVPSYQRLPHNPQRSADGKHIMGYEVLFEGERSERRYFFLPELRLQVQGVDAKRHAILARAFHALGVMAKHLPRKRYAHGYIGGHNSFKPNEIL